MGLGSTFDYVIGIDEVGRGCLAGPVVAGATLWSHKQTLTIPEALSGVKDSKLLKESERERLAPFIRTHVLGYSVQEASVEEIDAINILRASHLAMVRCVQDLLKQLETKTRNDPDNGSSVDHAERVLVLIDGNMIPNELKKNQGVQALVKGDLKSMSIAAASILAKVYRDGLMQKLHEKYPQYGLEKHKGYPTPAHKKAVHEFGVSEIHRKSFSV